MPIEWYLKKYFRIRGKWVKPNLAKNVPKGSLQVLPKQAAWELNNIKYSHFIRPGVLELRTVSSTTKNKCMFFLNSSRSPGLTRGKSVASNRPRIVSCSIAAVFVKPKKIYHMSITSFNQKLIRVIVYNINLLKQSESVSVQLRRYDFGTRYLSRTSNTNCNIRSLEYCRIARHSESGLSSLITRFWHSI